MPIITGICGGSASGKSLLTRLIKENIGNDIVTIISQDNFYKGLPDNINPESYNFDHPDAIDFNSLIDCIKKLKEGKEVDIPIYDFKIHQRIEKSIKVKPSPIVIIEGILIFCNNSLFNLFDYKVFIDANSETRIFRRIERDMGERGRDIGFIKTQYNKFVGPSYKEFIKPFKKKSDLIIFNNNEVDLKGSIEKEQVFVGIKTCCEHLKNKLD